MGHVAPTFQAVPRTPGSPEYAQDLRRACEEFEALFLGMVLRAMRATVSPSGLLPGGTARSIFEGAWTDEIARAAARTDPLRLAGMLFEALGAGGPAAAGPPARSSASPDEPKMQMDSRGHVERRAPAAIEPPVARASSPPRRAWRQEP